MVYRDSKVGAQTRGYRIYFGNELGGTEYLSLAPLNRFEAPLR